MMWKSPTALLLALATLGQPAFAQSHDHTTGYRKCSLHNLAACDNSNELFWGRWSKNGKAVRKDEFPDALMRFLRGAPELYLGRFGFEPAQVASESMVGPGSHHDALPDGYWFFDGFTPHEALDQAAVLFDAKGTVVAVALLNTDVDERNAKALTAADLSRYRLRIYCHAPELPAALMKVLTDWGRQATPKGSMYRGVFPDSSLIGTELIVLHGQEWRIRALP